MIINQPFEDSLGNQLINQLQSGLFANFKFITAYTKISGVNRLIPYMKLFRENGGIINGIVGIDQENTSYEALVSLLNNSDSLFIYHSENPSKTFHVKAYSFEGDKKFWTAVGSNNFTAGGLFGNYESCIISNDSDFMRKLYSTYSNTESPCCKTASLDLINLLLEKGYIRKERSLISQRISHVKSQKKRSKEDIIFGDEITPIPPQIQRSKETNQNNYIQREIDHPKIDDEETRYLIRFVPKAGKRSKQVHFTVDILLKFFQKSAGDHLCLQQVTDIYTPHKIEKRQIVFSDRNRNVRVEVSGAEYLNDHYPTDTLKKPILLFKRTNDNLYEYMLLLDGMAGYSQLNNRLNSLNWHGKSFPYEISSSETLFSLWEDCPLV
ncbi:MAG: phospholipase D-like domain-containing protein [Vulcanibacillus sp.]